MSSVAIVSPASVNHGPSYAENVARAARQFLAALLAVKPEAGNKAEVKKRKKADEVSLYRLYRLVGSYDSMMPNLRQELEMIANRH